MSPLETHAALREFWIENNLGFLARYWQTAGEAVQKVAEDPEGFSEFRGDGDKPAYVDAVVQNHLENHNFAGVLLCYSVFEEFMHALLDQLAEAHDAPIKVNELRDRGVRRYEKFVHKVCRIPKDSISIDWEFLLDLSLVRNAIIHCHGNLSAFGQTNQLKAVVKRRSTLRFKHDVRLVVSEDFVIQTIMAVRTAALEVNRLVQEGMSVSG